MHKINVIIIASYLVAIMAFVKLINNGNDPPATNLNFFDENRKLLKF